MPRQWPDKHSTCKATEETASKIHKVGGNRIQLISVHGNCINYLKQPPWQSLSSIIIIISSFCLFFEDKLDGLNTFHYNHKLPSPRNIKLNNTHCSHSAPAPSSCIQHTALLKIKTRMAKLIIFLYWRCNDVISKFLTQACYLKEIFQFAEEWYLPCLQQPGASIDVFN